MVVKLKIFVAILTVFHCAGFSCGQNKTIESVPKEQTTVTDAVSKKVIPGAERIQEYLPFLQGKKTGAVVNHTSMVGAVHLVDTLLALGVNIQTIFAPEHGFRGTASDGETLKDGKDPATGLPLLSLYGSKKKPAPSDLANLDIVIFDIQDVGARFYTYISTMSYVMEACAESGKPVLVLDRPNPNGHYVDGPVLEKSQQSFVGLHEVPAVYGMTIGEYAQMVNGEGWLAGGLKCDLTVVKCENYDHQTYYDLPVKPSPNLPNMKAIYLYPSLCFFEGTIVSVGRGTNKQFQVTGAPGFPAGDYTFTPVSMEGAKFPPQEGKECRGYDLTVLKTADLQKRTQIDLSYLLRFYRDYPDKKAFFLKTLYFDKLAGSTQLREQIIQGLSENEIRQTWQPGLEKFKSIRKKYLLYAE